MSAVAPTIRGIAIRLAGPLQAWGGPIVGDNRPTLAVPTRSGVLGVVACCLGIPRTEISALLALNEGARVHVRVDEPGVALVDDQTIQDNPNASPTRQTIQSKRGYLADASFVAVVVPGSGYDVDAIWQALRFPRFAPFLGRRSCVPSSPLIAMSDPRVEADDIVGLFETVPFEPQPQEFVDIFADDDLPNHPQRLRLLRQRDALGGPLRRQFRERALTHLRVPSETMPAPSTDTIDPWMPQ